MYRLIYDNNCSCFRMRVSRRVSGFYKPVLLILSVCAIIYLVQDSKSDTEDDIEETNVSIVYHFTFLLI